MPFYFAHAGTKLYKVSAAGDPTEVTLPSGVTMSETNRSRFAAMGNYVVVVNGPSINIAVDLTTLATTPMSIIQPVGVPTVAPGAAGVLIGDFQYKVSHAIQSTDAVLSESPLSLASAVVSLASQKGELTGIPISPDPTVTHRRLYRTTSGGSVFFFLDYIGDNTATTYTDNTLDEGLSTIAAPDDLGNPSGSTTARRIREIATWKGRLWAATTDRIDSVIFSGVDKFYGWAEEYELRINPTGQSGVGVNAFLPRRDELGVSKEEGLWKITGDDIDTFRVEQQIAAFGVLAPESVVVIRDTAYFLSIDGVYAWGSDGLVKLSSRVDAWFKTDDYFDPSQFPNAFARWNVREDTYELHLYAAGSSTPNRWVSYDLSRQLWLGPHHTEAFTPSSASQLENISGVPLSVIGGTDGLIYRANGTSFSDVASPIAFDAWTAFHQGGDPNLVKVWNTLFVHTGIEAAGTLTVTPYVGGTDAVAGTPMSAPLTQGRSRLARLGVGRLMALRFQQATANQGCSILAYECPVGVRGVR